MRLLKSAGALLAMGPLLLTSCSSGVPSAVSGEQPSAPSASAPSKPPEPAPAPAKGPEKIVLRVAPFAWIPEPASFFRWIESDFEAKHPDIDLVVRDHGLTEAKGDLAYDIDKTVAALTGKAADDSQDLIEVDTVILGALKASDAIAPFQVEGPRFLPFAAEAVQLAGQSYGVPHWTCGYFIISENPAIRGATNLQALLKLLATPANDKVDIAGDLDGSWDSILVYLDAVRDTDPGRDLTAELKKTALDPAVVASMGALGKACKKDGKSLCGADASAMFAAGQADAMIGYSERLHPVLSAKDRKVSTLHVASAPLGKGSHPTLFTDALVLSPKCKDACAAAAQKFASHYVSDQTFEKALLAKDAGANAVPRYLLPSTETAFTYGEVAKNELYKELRAAIQDAKPFPREGVPEAKASGSIRKQLKKALGLPE